MSVKFWDEHLHESAQWVWNPESDFGSYSRFDPDKDFDRALRCIGQLKQTIRDLYDSGKLKPIKGTVEEKRAAYQKKNLKKNSKFKGKKAWEVLRPETKPEDEFPTFKLPEIETIR